MIASRAAAALLALSAAHFPLLAQAQSPEALGWLRKIHEATQKLSYSGTFVYQHGGRTETSRITRDARGDIERLEVLDGVPREIVRTRDTVKCYLPESRVVKIDRRSADRSFPALLPDRVGELARHYEIELGGMARVADLDCQTVMLTPKDSLRYGYRLFADAKSGMLLKAVTFDAKGDTVEQFTFTQLVIGGVTRDQVKPRHKARQWRVEDAQAAPGSLPGWGLSAELPGFRKVIELKRRMGKSRPVSQVVYSDGLAAVSVFIEAMEDAADPVQTGTASLGGIHIFTRQVANHRVTVVGETPAASVQRIGNAVEYHRPQ